MSRRKPKSKGGRPTKFTIPAAVTLACSLNMGATLLDAARHAKISEATIHRWIDKALQGVDPYSVLLEVLKPVGGRVDCGKVCGQTWFPATIRPQPP